MSGCQYTVDEEALPAIIGNYVTAPDGDRINFPGHSIPLARPITEMNNSTKPVGWFFDYCNVVRSDVAQAHCAQSTPVGSAFDVRTVLIFLATDRTFLPTDD